MIKTIGAAVLVLAVAFMVLAVFTMALRVWWPWVGWADALFTLCGIAIAGWCWRGSWWDGAKRQD